MVATALPMRGDGDGLPVDFDAYAAHCRWLTGSGCDGVVANGSLGEYQTLTPRERARVIETAAEAVGGRNVMAGAGVPVVAYNNPYDTKVDLTPALLARLHEEGLIVAVKEFTGDPRRAYEIAELAPGLDVLIGSDDVLLELAVAGAVGWIAGYPNALPVSGVALYEAAVAGDLDTALPLYRALHPLLRWDSKSEFVQAIKLSMDVAGRYGGPCRPPRQPLTEEQTAIVRAATGKALAEGLR
ncbi:dihydrodipicolinate synthase family protein [Nonomuraea deserti]|uniref:Dihydrodipicolinate synthase family protein n=2 Tax=Nonomuraea deserti TaxID=1848322 RepID=A0A4R4VXS4_9ACTN|nr:dihydrodipicolinate synthase family protein [Nonomuraea deserti]